MAENKEVRKKFDGEDVEILGDTYEDGIPDGPDKWRGKMRDREEMLKFIKTGQRYWYGDGFGSEKRKNPA